MILGFILFVICLAFWICTFMSFTKYAKFSSNTFSSETFSLYCIFLPFFWFFSNINVRLFSIVTQVFEGLPFFFQFFSPCLTWIIPVFYLQAHCLDPLSSPLDSVHPVSFNYYTFNSKISLWLSFISSTYFLRVSILPFILICSFNLICSYFLEHLKKIISVLKCLSVSSNIYVIPALSFIVFPSEFSCFFICWIILECILNILKIIP